MKIAFTLEDGATPPTRAHDTDAGLDLHSLYPHTIQPGQRTLINTGIHIAIPEGYVGMICPRSGLAHKHGLTVLNAPGIIDPGYTGEIKVNLHNTSDKPHHINIKDRVAQLVITPIHRYTLDRVQALQDTERGDQGHGSTGQ